MKIANIRTVFDGEFSRGEIPMRTVGRHCDAFVYFLSGGAEYRFRSGTSRKSVFMADQDCFIYLAKDSLYAIRVPDKSRFVCVDFDFDASAGAGESSAFLSNALASRNTFTKIYRVWNEKKPWVIPQTFSLLYELVSEAVRCENQAYAGKSELLSEITAYVLSHYAEPGFSVGSISDFSGVSETHLRRLFRRFLRTTPTRYINALRLERAKNMLTCSNYSVREIAASVGFEDPYYFSRFFRCETGVSPTQYRTSAGGL